MSSLIVPVDLVDSTTDGSDIRRGRPQVDVKQDLDGLQTKGKEVVYASLLPFEILRVIFLMALTYTSPTTGFKRNYVSEPLQKKEPLSFTYVCSWWRSVALGIPELWNSLSATRDWAGYMTHGVIRIWLENASASFDRQTQMESGRGIQEDLPAEYKALALNFHLAPTSLTPNCTDFHYARHTMRTLRLFGRHIHHCRSMNLVLNTEMIRQFNLIFGERDNDGVAPLLEEVGILTITYSGSVEQELKSLIKWLGKLPVLRRLKLDISSSISLSDFPFSKLDVIVLAVDKEFGEVLQVLAQCTSAQRIRLFNMAWTPPYAESVLESIPSLPFTLPKLTHLFLSGKNNPLHLLDYINLPALIDLNVRYPRMERARTIRHPPPNFGAFLKRSACSIHKLVLYNPNTTENEAVEFLRIPRVSMIRHVDVYYTSPNPPDQRLRRVQSIQGSNRMFVKSDAKDAGYHVGWGMNGTV